MSETLASHCTDPAQKATELSQKWYKSLGDGERQTDVLQSSHTNRTHPGYRQDRNGHLLDDDPLRSSLRVQHLPVRIRGNAQT